MVTTDNTHVNLTGQRFTRLVVIEEKARRKNLRYWLCQCDCGTKTIVNHYDLLKGHSKSCGCLNRELSSQRRLKHGLTGTPEFDTWLRIITRCTNANNPDYPRYGGRGIKICQRWLDSFENFLADMGNRPSGDYSIDRINNNGDYEPSNCRWATRITQCNNRRGSRFLAYNGEMLTIAQWARKIGIPCRVIVSRLNQYHWSIERALTEPVRVTRRLKR